LQFKQRLTEYFPDLFGGTDEEPQGFQSAEAAFTERNGWYNSIYALAGGSFEKFDAVESKPILAALRFLEYEKGKIELENKRIEKSMKR
jgi:hypothetical protein